MNDWFYLLLAIVFEVAGTSSMKLSIGMTQLKPTLFMFFFYALAFSFLALALRTIEMSAAYAVWAGGGIVLVVLIDFFIFQTRLSTIDFLAITLIVIGAVMLKLKKTIILPRF